MWHSVMAQERGHLHLEWFPVSTVFPMLFTPPPGWIFHGKIKVPFTTRRKCLEHCRTKGERKEIGSSPNSPSSGNSGTNEITVETQPWGKKKKKRNPADEEGEEQDRNQKKWELTDPPPRCVFPLATRAWKGSKPTVLVVHQYLQLTY